MPVPARRSRRARNEPPEIIPPKSDEEPADGDDEADVHRGRKEADGTREEQKGDTEHDDTVEVIDTKAVAKTRRSGRSRKPTARSRKALLSSSPASDDRQKRQAPFSSDDQRSKDGDASSVEGSEAEELQVGKPLTPSTTSRPGRQRKSRGKKKTPIATSTAKSGDEESKGDEHSSGSGRDEEDESKDSTTKDGGESDSTSTSRRSKKLVEEIGSKTEDNEEGDSSDNEPLSVMKRKREALKKQKQALSTEASDEGDDQNEQELRKKPLTNATLTGDNNELDLNDEDRSNKGTPKRKNTKVQIRKNRQTRNTEKSTTAKSSGDEGDIDEPPQKRSRKRGRRGKSPFLSNECASSEISTNDEASSDESAKGTRRTYRSIVSKSKSYSRSASPVEDKSKYERNSHRLPQKGKSVGQKGGVDDNPSGAKIEGHDDEGTQSFRGHQERDPMDANGPAETDEKIKDIKTGEIKLEQSRSRSNSVGDDEDSRDGKASETDSRRISRRSRRKRRKPNKLGEEGTSDEEPIPTILSASGATEDLSQLSVKERGAWPKRKPVENNAHQHDEADNTKRIKIGDTTRGKVQKSGHGKNDIRGNSNEKVDDEKSHADAGLFFPNEKTYCQNETRESQQALRAQAVGGSDEPGRGLAEDASVDEKERNTGRREQETDNVEQTRSRTKPNGHGSSESERKPDGEAKSKVGEPEENREAVADDGIEKEARAGSLSQETAHSMEVDSGGGRSKIEGDAVGEYLDIDGVNGKEETRDTSRTTSEENAIQTNNVSTLDERMSSNSVEAAAAAMDGTGSGLRSQNYANEASDEITSDEMKSCKHNEIAGDLKPEIARVQAQAGNVESTEGAIDGEGVSSTTVGASNSGDQVCSGMKPDQGKTSQIDFSTGAIKGEPSKTTETQNHGGQSDAGPETDQHGQNESNVESVDIEGKPSAKVEMSKDGGRATSGLRAYLDEPTGSDVISTVIKKVLSRPSEVVENYKSETFAAKLGQYKANEANIAGSNDGEESPKSVEATKDGEQAAVGPKAYLDGAKETDEGATDGGSMLSKPIEIAENGKPKIAKIRRELDKVDDLNEVVAGGDEQSTQATGDATDQRLENFRSIAHVDNSTVTTTTKAYEAICDPKAHQDSVTEMTATSAFEKTVCSTPSETGHREEKSMVSTAQQENAVEKMQGDAGNEKSMWAHGVLDGQKSKRSGSTRSADAPGASDSATSDDSILKEVDDAGIEQYTAKEDSANNFDGRGLQDATISEAAKKLAVSPAALGDSGDAKKAEEPKSSIATSVVTNPVTAHNDTFEAQTLNSGGMTHVDYVDKGATQPSASPEGKDSKQEHEETVRKHDVNKVPNESDSMAKPDLLLTSEAGVEETPRETKQANTSGNSLQADGLAVATENPKDSSEDTQHLVPSQDHTALTYAAKVYIPGEVARGQQKTGVATSQLGSYEHSWEVISHAKIAAAPEPSDIEPAANTGEEDQFHDALMEFPSESLAQLPDDLASKEMVPDGANAVSSSAQEEKTVEGLRASKIFPSSFELPVNDTGNQEKDAQKSSRQAEVVDLVADDPEIKPPGSMHSASSSTTKNPTKMQNSARAVAQRSSHAGSDFPGVTAGSVAPHDDGLAESARLGSSATRIATYGSFSPPATHLVSGGTYIGNTHQIIQPHSVPAVDKGQTLKISDTILAAKDKAESSIASSTGNVIPVSNTDNDNGKGGPVFFNQADHDESLSIPKIPSAAVDPVVADSSLNSLSSEAVELPTTNIVEGHRELSRISIAPGTKLSNAATPDEIAAATLTEGEKTAMPPQNEHGLSKSASEDGLGTTNDKIVKSAEAVPELLPVPTDFEYKVRFGPPALANATAPSTAAPVDAIDSERLKKVKTVLYAAGSRAHRGSSFERIFAEYWDAMALRLSDRLSSHTSERCQIAIDKFLKTARLRKLHNRFIMSIMRRAMRTAAAYDEVSAHVPRKWHKRVERVYAEPAELCNERLPEPSLAIQTSLLAPAASCYREAWDNSLPDPKPLGNERRRQRTLLAPKSEAASSSLPGALTVDPSVRKIIEGNEMEVSDLAIWLMVVAVKEHSSNILRSAISHTEATHRSELAPRPFTFPKLLATGTRPPTKRDVSLDSKSSRSDRNARFSRTLTALDIYAGSSKMPYGGIGSVGGSISRGMLEMSLHASFDHLPVVPAEEFTYVQHFITDQVFAEAKARKVPLKPSRDEESRIQESNATTKAGKTKHQNSFAVPSPAPAHTSTIVETSSGSNDQQNVATTQVAAPAAPTAVEDPQKAMQGGMGRGAKNLAALMRRTATSTSPGPEPAPKEEANKGPAGEQLKKPEILTQIPTSNIRTSEESQVNNESEEEGGQRRGKGFGIKNLARMLANKDVDPK